MNDNEHTPQQDMTPAIESKNRYVLPETKKKRKKAPLIIGIIAAVVLAAVLVAVLFWWSNRETEGPVETTGAVTEEGTTEHIHVEIILEAVDPTCTETGLTEGKQCEDCGEILLDQEIIPATEHEYGAWVIEKEPQIGVEGSKYVECTICGYVLWESVEMLYSEGLAYTSNGDGTCYVSGIGSCTDLEIAIPPKNHNEEIVTGIGEGSFSDCSTFISIYIPESIESIGNGAFFNCSKLTSIVIPGSVTHMGYNTFSVCQNLRIVTLENGIKSIGHASFEDCINLAFIDIPDSVESIGAQAFSGCFSLSRVTMGNGVLRIGDHAFSNCKSLRSVNIPDGVISIGQYAFSDCEYLTSIDIPDSVMELGERVFNNCYRLVSATIGNGVLSIGQYTFAGCNELSSVVIGSGVRSISGSAFASCDNLTDEENGVHYVDKWVVDCDTAVTAVVLRDGTEGIADGAFASCASLTSISFPDSLRSIGIDAFRNCDRLKIYDNGVYYVNQWAIEYDNTTVDIVLREDTKGSADGLFSRSWRITSVFIPASVTNIGINTFRFCSSIMSIKVAENNPVYHSDGNCLIETQSKTLLYGCRESIIPNSVTRINDFAFASCKNLSSIVIPDSVMDIGDASFCLCTELTSVVIPNSVTSIGDFVFQASEALTDIYYTGTESEWEAITKGTDWDGYTGNYTIHYNYVPN